SRIYGAAATPSLIRLGSLASAESIPALVDVNRLITRHSAVVGTTGAGKSTTVAGLLCTLTDPARNPSARVIIFDIHGEYFQALSDRATVFRVNANEEAGERQLSVPYWALSFDELLCLTPFAGVGDTDRAGLIDKVRELKLASLAAQPRGGVTQDTLTVDSPIPFSIHRLWYELYRLVCSTHTDKGQNQSAATEAIQNDVHGQPMVGDIMRAVPPRYEPITAGGADRVYLASAPLNLRRQLLAMQSVLLDSRFDFLFRPGPWCPEPTLDNLDAQPTEDLDSLLSQWIGGDSPITILDLSGVPASILTSIIGVLIRLISDALLWARALPEGGRQRPLLFVLEEAHNYLGTGTTGSAATATRRVVKEGRKYGLGAMIVSQRPAEIDATILSQCGTIFAMRLANSTDRAHVANAVTDNLEGLLAMLPALRTGEAIVVGESVQLPLRALIDPPSGDRRPDSDDPKVYDSDAANGWNAKRKDEDYLRVVRAWRSEGRAVPKEEEGE
ncbi:MAG: DUF87 domain-containing protein, partial [Actinobacteria bacterium]|nr:DUF87 domain-containing protein [Actinomycetota bacterium]